MTKAKPVQGPYELNYLGLIYGQVDDDEDEAPFVADVCRNSGEFFTEQETATGFLLAASWDLLKACEAVEHAQRSGDYATAFEAVRAAIAKAKGGAA